MLLLCATNRCLDVKDVSSNKLKQKVRNNLIVNTSTCEYVPGPWVAVEATSPRPPLVEELEHAHVRRGRGDELDLQVGHVGRRGVQDEVGEVEEVQRAAERPDSYCQ